MQVRQTIACFGILVLLQGCASTPEETVSSPYPALKDALFPSYTLFEPESEEAVFMLDEEAAAFVAGAMSPNRSDHYNMRQLVKNIFEYSDAGLQYRNSANTVASRTFQNQTANCLSLSIMTYAMAAHAGYRAQFYEVDIPEYWTRRDGYSLLNGHINLRISLPDEQNVTRMQDDYMDVDFDPQNVREYFPRRKLKKRVVLSMFYNNKGADALIASSYSKAYAYFRKAALLSPELPQSWVNLGVLYRQQDAYAAAEEAYERAIALDNENFTAWENLAILYRYTDRHDQADQIAARLERRREDNPFYHFILGEQALEAEQLEEALTHYRRAMRLDSTRHEVLFGLGKTYFEMGDVTRARQFIERAARHAPNAQEQQRYQGKLSVLQSRSD
ncbi:tetratricopeptide repeat protein [Alteromonas salexigens]|nr:tetratricopeptide repeat protein [Alteromonas salexigens]